jgi:tetratricopeptide (TPR) repeat protein
MTEKLENQKKELAILECEGADHPDTATSYNNIGYIYNSMGNLSKALEYYQKAKAARGEQ